MKVKFGPYTNWVGPYQIAEALMFWADKYDEESKWGNRVHRFGTWLAQDKNGDDSWLTKLCNWIHSFKRRQEYVKLDYYDHWNVDHTLSLIIAPLLIQLKKHKQGFGFIDDEDVPEHLQSKFGIKENEWEWDSLAEQRYEYVLNEMIWAFQQHKRDDETDEFYDHGEKVKGENIMDSIRRIKIDQVGLDAHNKRKQEGFRLFGKYFQTLWD